MSCLSYVLAPGKRQDRRPPAISPERVRQIVAALEEGVSKASMCRSLKVPCSTLLDTAAGRRTKGQAPARS